MDSAAKRQFSRDAWQAIDHELVQRVIAEFADNHHLDLDGLPGHGLRGVAGAAALVARAQALGLDPDELRLTAAEQRSATLERAARMVYEGIPTTVGTAQRCPTCNGRGAVLMPP